MHDIQAIRQQLADAAQHHRKAYIRLQMALNALVGEIEDNGETFTIDTGEIEDFVMPVNGFRGTMSEVKVEPEPDPSLQITDEMVAPEPTVKRIKRKPRHQSRELPDTGGDFFLSLLTKRPQTRSELLLAAIEKIGFTPDTAQHKRLRDRLSDWLMRKARRHEIVVNTTGDRHVFSARAS